MQERTRREDAVPIGLGRPLHYPREESKGLKI